MLGRLLSFAILSTAEPGFRLECTVDNSDVDIVYLFPEDRTHIELGEKQMGLAVGTHRVIERSAANDGSAIKLLHCPTSCRQKTHLLFIRIIQRSSVDAFQLLLGLISGNLRPFSKILKP